MTRALAPRSTRIVAEASPRPVGRPRVEWEELLEPAELGTERTFPPAALPERSRRRKVVQTYEIIDEVAPAAGRAAPFRDREGVLSRALRAFFAVLGALFGVMVLSGALGYAVQLQMVPAFVLLGLGCGLLALAWECWTYRHA